MSSDWINIKVQNRVNLADGIVGLTLVTLDGTDLPAFTAGAHIDVELPNKLVRQYSLSNQPTDRHQYQIGVLLDPSSRGGSKSVHEDLQEGSRLRISKPHNHFPLADADHSILLAGGIGITPILCMAKQLSSQSKSFDMHYCTRTKSAMAYNSELAASNFSDHVYFHYDNGTEDQKLDIEKVLATPKANTHIYVCGPKGFMDFVINSAHQLGWPADSIHFEFFSGAQPEHQDGDHPFQVKINSTGQLIDVSIDETIVQALTNNGVNVPTSCEQGICGTCITGILDGTPDHRDMYFTDKEKEANNQLIVCCSRSTSPLLVLDL
jgi:vanillate O-demethylase ferredoxin subunit